MNTPLRIAIVGAGPGGLMLARLLCLQGADVSVFERESHALQRPQGGTLDLHADSGQRALKRAGLLEGFRSIARYEDQGTRLFDMSGQLLFEDDDAASDDRPEVDRTALRHLLLDSLPVGMVRWGHSLLELQQAQYNTWTLRFEHGQAGPFDLVVGADGAWSRVRPLLSPYQPHYSGLTLVEFGLDDVDARHPQLAALVGRGKASVEGNGKALIVQRNSNAHLRGYAFFRVPLGWTEQRFDFTSPEHLRAQLLEEFADFGENLQALLRASNDRFVSRPIHALPIGHCWQHRAGLTLIGDAAHVMSPFGGEGVNNAMLDALELSEALTAQMDISRGVSRYEQRMFARIVESARDASEGAATFLSHDGQALTLARYRGHRG